MEEKKLTEESVSDSQTIEPASQKDISKSKIINFLIRLGVSLIIIAALYLFFCLLIYTFENDGADYLRKIA